MYDKEVTVAPGSGQVGSLLSRLVSRQQMACANTVMLVRISV